ncbi:MAG: S9 family peptidase [Pseudomonadota bacterium]
MMLSVSRFVLSRCGAACAAAVLATIAPVSAAEAGPTVPLEEYGKLPDVEVTAISPSGDRIAYVGTLQGTRVLIAIEDQTKTLTAVRVGDMKVRSLRWIGEDRLMLTSSQTEDLSARFTTDKAEFFIARIIPIAPGEEGGVVFGNSRKHPDTIQGNYGVRKVGDRNYGFFGGIELDRGRTGSRTSTRLDHTRPHLFRVDLGNFKIKKVANAAPINTGSDWLIDAKGELAYSMQVDYTTGAWWVRNAQGKKILDGVQPRASVGLIGLGYGGETAIVRERTDTGVRWIEIGQAGGTPKPFLEGVDFEGLFFDPATGHLMGYTEGEGDQERHVFADKDLHKKAERVRKAFKSSESSFAGWTSDLSDVIIRTSGNGDSGTYFAVDLGTNRANAIAYERDAIAANQVGAISTFAYTASDGMELDGILTLPPGREAKNLPVVLLPHGGPHSADAPKFDWWAQAFASRGYAVFQPNFRGSTNRDVAFTRAGYGEWGRRMQLDKSDGLKALAEVGVVDANRACIVGASYGGYAALAGVTIQQGLYKCSVAVAPVSDLSDMYREDYQASGKDRTTKVSLLERLGDPDLWDEVSPLRRADEADAPIMLIHGVDDVVVPYSHSTRMADKLKDAKKPYELVTLKGEDHWLSLSTTRKQMLSNAVRWVEKYNPAD